MSLVNNIETIIDKILENPAKGSIDVAQPDESA